MMDNQEKKVNNQGILFEKEKQKKKDNKKAEKDQDGIDYIPPTPEPASNANRKHDDPIRDHNPSVL